MKLRKPACGFKPSVYGHTQSVGFWDFDKSYFNPTGKIKEMTSPISRPSGKGRFGKQSLSIPVDGGHSNDSNSNDSGVGCENSSESQSHMSWCSEDSYLVGSSSISNLSSVGVPQFPALNNKELFENPIKDIKPNLNVGYNSKTQVANLFDTNSAKLLLPEKARLVSSGNMRMSPDSTDAPFQLLSNQRSTSSPEESLRSNSNSPTSTMSPIPMKRARFSYPNQIQQTERGSGLKLRNQNQNGRNIIQRLPPGTIPTLISSLTSTSRDGRVQLQIVSQPEEQHRARYQTEGSRGAIKDRKGNGFPTVKLIGYDKPATLQIFIGTDQGKVSPHMFYQACKVTGKSSTPCLEKKIEGTILIEIEFEPSKDMVISCDCVGILKERNVDVEQRFPFHHASQSRKKSTRCRMIYRTTIINSAGLEETLQISSLPILCTQPPGLPEICKQSLFECPAKGGLELFVIGKNFLKDTQVIFQDNDADSSTMWESPSEPLKDYLQQNHLICAVPPYKDQSIVIPVECNFIIISGGKHSEPHRFTYLPNLPPVHYGIQASCVMKDISGQTSSPDSVIRNLSGSKHILSMDLQGIEPSLIPRNESSGNDSTSSSDVTSSTRNTVTVCQPSISTVHQQLGGSSPTLEPLPQLPFSNNIIPTTTAQERQVVSELQCILEQSSHQNQQHDQAVTDMMTATNILSVKPETSYSNIDLSSNSITSSTVPLDLQFPTDNIQSLRTISYPIQNPQYTSVQQINCMSPVITSQLLSGTSNMELIADQKLLTELLPGSQTLVSSANNFLVPLAPTAIPMSSTLHNGMAMTVSGSVPEMSVGDCIAPGIIKKEPQTITTNISNISLGVNSISVLSQTQPTTVTGVNINPGNYIIPDLQGHQGTITNEITQMSDNELINLINPSCFEQSLV